MDNQRFFYLVEGECEEKLLNALKMNPPLIHPGKVEKFNIIQNEIPRRKLMQYPAGCVVVFVFDRDKEVTADLQANLKSLSSLPFKVEIMTVPQVLTFEDEIKRSTDVNRAQDLTKSKTVNDFKSAVNKVKEKDFRSTLIRHKLDMGILWSQKPPKAFSFIRQGGDKIKM